MKRLMTILALLLMAGLLALFSATYYKALETGDPFSEVKKQLFGMAIGAVAMLFTSRIPYWFWGRHNVAIGGLIISAVLLTLVISLFSGCSQEAQTSTEQVIKIGVFEPFTGENASGGNLDRTLFADALQVEEYVESAIAQFFAS